jgi:iron complex outermembrane recepter protein
MSRFRRGSIQALAFTTLASLSAAPVLSAESPDALQEVLVTATKRTESVRDVAVPMSAVTGADLAESNANSLGDYVTRIPGVVFNDYQPGVSEIVIRGIAATTYHEQGQTTVGYYLNDVALVEPGFPIGIPDIDTFDLDRVEVLRGPQGTLFGSSTLGGLINYVAKTADPSKFDSAAEALLGGGRNQDGQLNYAVKGMLNVPLSDVLAFRVTAVERFDAGYLDNIGTGQKGSNDFRTQGARGSLVYKPSDDTTVTLMSTYQQTKLDDQTYLTLGTYERDTPRAEPQKTDFWLTSLRLDQNVGFANLTVLGSFDKKTNYTVFTYPYAYVTGVTTGAAAAWDPTNAFADIKTAEVRLASKDDGGPLRWLVGSSFLRADKSSTDHIYQQGAAAYIDAHSADFGGYSGSVLAPGDAIYGYITDTFNKDFGVFGEVSYKPIEQIELTVGGRYYDTKNGATITNKAGSLGGGTFTPADATFGTTQSENGFTPKATLAWRPQKGTLVYATYSEGFRVGGPNPNAAILPGIPKTYDSDKVKNYEIGTKLSLLDNQLFLDLTGFHIDWKNIQARLFTDAPYFYSYVTNAGSAKIDGVEFSATAHVNRYVSFTTNGTYQNARLSTFLPDTFAVGGGYTPGTVLPGSSKWAVANNLRFQWPDVTGMPGIELAHRYLSTAPVAFGDPPPATRGNFHEFDLRASYTIGENYHLIAFVDNLFDRYGVLNAPFANQATPAGSIIRPRTYGLRLDWHL